jgi:arylsulfatase A-like enzyme
VLFTNCFAQASWTKPSFATIFTGLYPESHTATGKQSMLPDSVLTVSELLRDSGYYTCAFANNPNITSAFNFDQGFVEYTDLEPERYFWASASVTRLSLYGFLRRARGRLLGERMVVTDFYQPAEIVTDKALDWLDKREVPRDVPFYLMLHYMDPHDPYIDHDVPGVGYARRDMEHPDPAQYREVMKRAYISEIEYMDQHLGRLFEGLRRRGLYDGAAILFMADHGEEFYDHGGWWHGQTLYEEQIRVPLLLKFPDNRFSGTTNSGFARHVDLAPTVLHFAGLPPGGSMQGQPLIGEGERFTNAGLRYVYAEEDFEGNRLQAVRTPNAKLIRANEGNRRNLAPMEFYNLQEDPGELTNLAGRGDGREGELGRLIEEMQAFICKEAAEPVLLEKIPDELKKQMEATGYL